VFDNHIPHHRTVGYAHHLSIPHHECASSQYLFKSDDHSELAPPLPIPNRTVKQPRADDSAATSVKVGYRQTTYTKNPC
jgi:hypothetical protein